MSNKYELLLDDTINIKGKTLYRIRALRAFGNVKAGDIGGFVESVRNLSQKGNCWVYHSTIGSPKGPSYVMGKAKVSDNALIFSGTKIYDNAIVDDSAQVEGAEIYGNSHVLNSASISGISDYKVLVYDGAIIMNNARLRGAVRVHGDAKISGDSTLYGHVQVSGAVYIGGTVSVYDDVRIAGSDVVIGGSVRILDDVVIDDFVKIKCAGTIKGYTRIVDKVKIDTRDPVFIAGSSIITGDTIINGRYEGVSVTLSTGTYPKKPQVSTKISTKVGKVKF